MSETSLFRNYAFISYSHRDMAVARWLQRRLEGYRLPSEIHNDLDNSRYLRPVFRDQSDLNSGVLSEELRKSLAESKFLILICSAHSARSAWVSDEAKAFVEMGRLDRIIPLIIPSHGMPERELFPEYLRSYFAAHPHSELLGINIADGGRSKALIRVVSRMLGMNFDVLWKRHLRRLRRHLASSMLAAVVVAAATAFLAVPVGVSVSVSTEPSVLPPAHSLKLSIAGAHYEAPITDTVFTGIRLPGYYRLKGCDVSVDAIFCQPSDTLWHPGVGLHGNLVLVLRRDSSFTTFAGTVYDVDLRPIDGVSVAVGAMCDTTDGYGRFHLSLPLENQRETMDIVLEKDGFVSSTVYGETPSSDLKYILQSL